MGKSSRSKHFYTTGEVMQSLGNDTTKIFEGLQTSKGNYSTYRPGMTLYETTTDIIVAYSKALANPQYGPGGLDQYFILNYGNVLRPICTILLGNR